MTYFPLQHKRGPFSHMPRLLAGEFYLSTDTGILYTSLDGVTNVPVSGTSGPTGSQGTTGSQGITGIQGATGTQGTIGTQGTTGTQGTIGSGTQGATGVQGAIGAGTQGATGTQGTTGTGTQGATGAGTQGATGTQGVTGSQGTTGTGTQGTTGASGGSAARTTVSVSGGSLASVAAGTTISGSVTIAKSFLLQDVVCTFPTRVRLYETAAQRDTTPGGTSEPARPNTIPATPGTMHGLIVDLYLDNVNAPLTWKMSPSAPGVNNEAVLTSTIYYNITNIDTVTRSLTVTFTYLPLES